MENNSEGDSKINDFDYHIEEVLLSHSNSLFTNASITSPTEQSKSAVVPFVMIQRKKNERKIITDYNKEPTATQYKLEKETSNPKSMKKMQSAIRSKRYRERLKLKKESLKDDPILIDKNDSQSDIQGDIPVEGHDLELKEKIQNANEDDTLLSNKDDSQSDVQRDISMEALDPLSKKRMQAAIRSKRYRDRLKLRKSLEVDLLLINKNDSHSDVVENASAEALNKELKRKMQGAIRSRRYRERLKLKKELVNVDDFLLIKHDSECDAVSGDGDCLFFSLIRKLQHQMSTSDLPKQLLLTPNVHSCTDADNTMRILRGESDSEALDCVTVFSTLLNMNNGIWPIKYS